MMHYKKMYIQFVLNVVSTNSKKVELESVSTFCEFVNLTLLS